MVSWPVARVPDAGTGIGQFSGWVGWDQKIWRVVVSIANGGDQAGFSPETWRHGERTKTRAKKRTERVRGVEVWVALDLPEVWGDRGYQVAVQKMF